MNDVVVVGAGGFGRELLDVLEASNSQRGSKWFNVLGVLDDDPSVLDLKRLQRRGYSYLGGLSELFKLDSSVNYFVGVGDPRTRAQIAKRCKTIEAQPGVAVHPSASVGSDVELSPGSVVCGGAQLSTNVTLGRHVHINPAAIVGHDTRIGAYGSVNPGAIVSGDVSIDEQVLIGAGAVVLQGLDVGRRSIIGAGACVTRNVRAEQIVYGVPAREKVEDI